MFLLSDSGIGIPGQPVLVVLLLWPFFIYGLGLSMKDVFALDFLEFLLMVVRNSSHIFMHSHVLQFSCLGMKRAIPVAAMKTGPPVIGEVIAGVEVFKQVCKTADTEFEICLIVQRYGKTLVLYPGPDVEEAEKLIGKLRGTENVDANCPYHIFRSNMLRYSIVNYATASLGLSPANPQQVSTFTWLEHWRDNVPTTSVPKLEIYNLVDNVFQGDFDPLVFQHNGLPVLRFLQSNCKEDPGIYWLYKSAGEDTIRLFDFLTISKNHSSGTSLLPLVFRACALEQCARLILNNEDKNPCLRTKAVEHIAAAITSLNEMPPSEQIDKTMQSLVMLLGEAYLSLAVAYKEDKDLGRSLLTIHVACSIYGSLPQEISETPLFVSTISNSISLLFSTQNFENWVGRKFASFHLRDYISLKKFLPVHRFWVMVWLLVGDIYARLGFLLSPEGSESASKEELPSDIAAIVENLQKKLTAGRQESHSSKSKISKYLTGSRDDDAQANLLIALHCYREAQEALPSGCLDFFISLNQRTGCLWNEVGMKLFGDNRIKEAKEAFTVCAGAWENSDEHGNLILMKCKLADLHRYVAVELVNQLKPKPTTSNRVLNKAHREDLEDAGKEYSISLSYLIAAKEAVQKVVQEEDQEALRVGVSERLVDTYFLLAKFLFDNKTTAVTPTELKSIYPSRLSTDDVLSEAAAVFQSLGLDSKHKFTRTYHHTLAVYHERCFASLSSTSVIRATVHAALANTNWEVAIGSYVPENENLLDSYFLEIVLSRSKLNFNLPDQSNFCQMIDADLSRLLQCHNISEEEEKKLDEEELKEFWILLRKILFKMLREEKSSASEGGNKLETLNKLCEKSLRATGLGDLKEMHELWKSQ